MSVSLMKLIHFKFDGRPFTVVVDKIACFGPVVTNPKQTWLSIVGEEDREVFIDLSYEDVLRQIESLL